MRESDREGRIMIKVIKKDGTKEEFNVQKVVVAVNKSYVPCKKEERRLILTN